MIGTKEVQKKFRSPEEGENSFDSSSTLISTLPRPEVVILMATYQGEAFLEEQLNSLHTQSHSDWVLQASDDGSSDGTMALLKEKKKTWGKKKLHIAQRKEARHTKACYNATANFFSLVTQVPDSAPFYAFCDQDDIWLPRHLDNALQHLESLPDTTPALFCGASKMMDAHNTPLLNPQQLTPHWQKLNRLISCNALPGHGMVFNRAAFLQLKRSVLWFKKQSTLPPLHDWWLSLLVCALGGRIVHDKKATILYRQHADNAISAVLKKKPSSLIQKLRKHWTSFRTRSAKTHGPLQTRALLELANLSKENALFLKNLQKVQDRRFFICRLWGYFFLGVRRPVTPMTHQPRTHNQRLIAQIKKLWTMAVHYCTIVN